MAEEPKKSAAPRCDECGEPFNACSECDSFDECEREHLDGETRLCSRVDCGFEWIFTGEYLECPMCALREAKARIEVLTLEATTARAA